MRLGKIARFAAWAAVMTMAFGPVATAAANTPEALMRKIMDSYRPDAGEKGMLGVKYFDPALTKLDQDNSRLFDGVDVLDADPICQCQDVGADTYKWSGRSEGPDRWVATVSRSDVPRPWQVIWRRIKGRWVIYDVVDETGSIRTQLVRHNACAREKIARHQKPDSCSELK